MRSLTGLFASLALLSSTLTDAQYVAYSSHSDSDCESTPQQVAFVASEACTATTSATCKLSDTTGLYVSTGCVESPSSHTTTVFGGQPWVLLDIHEASSDCKTFVASVGYVADGSCLVVDDMSSSVIATVNSDKSVALKTYDGTKCSGTAVASHTIGASDLGKATCLNGVLLASASATTTSSTTTTTTPSTTEKASTSTKSHAPSIMQATIAIALAVAVAIVTV